MNTSCVLIYRYCLEKHGDCAGCFITYYSFEAWAVANKVFTGHTAERYLRKMAELGRLERRQDKKNPRQVVFYTTSACCSQFSTWLNLVKSASPEFSKSLRQAS